MSGSGCPYLDQLTNYAVVTLPSDTQWRRGGSTEPSRRFGGVIPMQQESCIAVCFPGHLFEVSVQTRFYLLSVSLRPRPKPDILVLPHTDFTPPGHVENRGIVSLRHCVVSASVRIETLTRACPLSAAFPASSLHPGSATSAYSSLCCLISPAISSSTFPLSLPPHGSLSYMVSSQVFDHIVWKP
jgi:hypothetical protein